MKRFFDLFISIALLIIFLVPLLLISILILSTSKGPFLYWSKRIGKENRIFYMPKFRTMSIDAPEVATHLLENPSNYYTPIGKFIRKFSIDEFPQLYSIIRGDMSLVGPRPALFNQEDLISLRTKEGVHDLIPGITGLAQVSGRDELSIVDKVRIDKNYLEQRSFKFDLYIIWLTVLKVLKRDDISH
tara:strand:- start:5236 stop:5796 length:561 start_codon:yes stop_codon:yes gene_type:complete